MKPSNQTLPSRFFNNFAAKSVSTSRNPLESILKKSYYDQMARQEKENVRFLLNQL